MASVQRVFPVLSLYQESKLDIQGSSQKYHPCSTLECGVERENIEYYGQYGTGTYASFKNGMLLYLEDKYSTARQSEILPCSTLIKIKVKDWHFFQGNFRCGYLC